MDDWFRGLINKQPESLDMGDVRACNCMGPQPGETLCPCALRSKMHKECAMLRDGIEIGGKRYNLVPASPNKP